MATSLENKINRIATNVAAALNALSAKGVSVTGADSDDLATLIDYLVKLPALTTAGAAADLRNGKQLIDGIGNIVTGTMPEQAAQTITPGTSDKTIASGRYLTGTQTIKGDSNLVAANIASGKTIFGVAGTFSGGGKIVNGTFSIKGNGVSHVITHNLGKVPNLALAYSTTGSLYGAAVGAFIMHLHYKGTNWLLQPYGYSYPAINMTQPTTAITASFSNGLGSATTAKITFTMTTNLNGSGGTDTINYLVGVV